MTASAFVVLDDVAKRWNGQLGVENVSLSIPRGSFVALLGPSGCGKSTTLRLLSGLELPDEGRIWIDGRDVTTTAPSERNLSMVFQSYALFPHLSVAENVVFGLKVRRTPRGERREKLHRALEITGLLGYENRKPGELSGGQRQRVNIARALAVDPRVVIFDEAVSALDKSVEAQVMNLLVDLKTEFGLSYVFISHDLNVVRYIADSVLVMYLGKVVEEGPVEIVYDSPAHPYARALLASMPSLDPEVRTLEAPIAGDPPSPIDPPSGCRFHTRCGHAGPVCITRAPEPMRFPSGREVSCHMADAKSGHAMAGSIAR